MRATLGRLGAPHGGPQIPATSEQPHKHMYTHTHKHAQMDTPKVHTHRHTHAHITQKQTLNEIQVVHEVDANGYIFEWCHEGVRSGGPQHQLPRGIWC